jgi:hypothetical protein
VPAAKAPSFALFNENLRWSAEIAIGATDRQTPSERACVVGKARTSL